jgi:valyl-tRNA synthetase
MPRLSAPAPTPPTDRIAMLEKTYTPKDIEARMSAAWEKAEAFKAGRADRAGADPFCIVIPPPNVTGSLHMGHALNNTLQDVLCRYERMRGKDVLWQPGTDHAGIATQMVVERKLAAENKTDRRTMGREAFLKSVWAWKEESGGTIVNQLKRVGASCDWSRERFTMDEGLSKAVLKVFVDLYKQGLIYKDKRLVNWDPKLLTAISDLEVVQTEMNGHLWYFRYPVEGVTYDAENPSTFVTVATTRPETLLGDTGVAVHPDDERFRELIGRNVIVPISGRRIPIVADDYSDPEKGSGAVKITPAHDFNDFEVGKRHNLRAINIFTVEAKVDLKDNQDFLEGLEATQMQQGLWDQLHGLDRFEARKLIVKVMEEGGFLAKIEPHRHTVPHGDRGGVPVEPFLTDQWYVDAKTLAQAPLEAVRSGRTVFVPKNWEKTFFEWMENIQPWCVSRQLWWGHQIPAWYGPDGKVFVEESEDEAYEAALPIYVQEEILTEDQAYRLASEPENRGDFLKRDEDVLDTWFSSALWPFSTLGWPDDTAEVKRFYQTDVLVTGFDIIFFWVARMMMMGERFMDETPFHTVYIHALVRDEKGAKMSKSKGNVIDPLDLIDQFGADALRFTLAAMAAQGRDIKLATSRVEGYRNFATKLWNAARFAEMNECKRVAAFDPGKVQSTLAKWIVGETAKAVADIEAGIQSYKFNEAAGAAYRFVWNIFCDWFLEFAKPVFTGSHEAAKAEIRATTAWTLDQILKLLHPFMPFITEELWAVTGEEGPARAGVLALGDWPVLAGLEDPEAEAEIGWLVDTISAIRSIRAEMNVAPVAQVPLVLVGSSAQTQERARRYGDLLNRLARLSDVAKADAAPKGSVQIVVRGETIALPLAGIVDVVAEKLRLGKSLKEAEGDIARCDAKLNNENFMSRAAEDVVEEQREKRAEAVERKAKVEVALARLSDLG